MSRSNAWSGDFTNTPSDTAKVVNTDSEGTTIVTKKTNNRLKWHPQTARSAAAPTRSGTRARAAAAPPTARVGSNWDISAACSAPAAAVALPPVWKEEQDPDTGDVFGHHPASNKTEREKPTEDDAPVPPPLEDAARPPGWVA